MTAPSTVACGVGRRQALLAVAACAARSVQAAPAWPTGWARPRRPAPALALTDSGGHVQSWRDRLQGSATAVQLIFTGCSSTCPTQGLLFAHMAARHQSRPVRWLSISIDALSDDPGRLRAWQERAGRHPAWQAAVPALRDVDAVVAFLRGGDAGVALHTTQVFGFDRAGHLAYRTGDAPPVALLDQLVDALV